MSQHRDRAHGVLCRWTIGHDGKTTSTLTFGLSSALDLAWRNDVDAALVLNPANGLFLPLLRSRGIPAVVNVDGLEWRRKKWSKAGKAVFLAGAHLTAKRATTVIADSEALAEIWLERFRVNATFIPYGAHLLPSGARAEHLEPLGLKASSYALVVARLAPENNVDLVLDALEFCPAVPVVVVGSANYDNPTAARLAALARTRVGFHWLGHVADQEKLNQLWSNAGVYIHGHSVGGTNPALLSALGCGSPTVALNTPFNYEVLRDPDALFPHDSAVLAARITHVLEDPAFQAALRDRGLSTVRKRYSWERVCQEYEDALLAASGRLALVSRGLEG